MRTWVGLCCCLVLAISAVAQFKRPTNVVPDKTTAVRIAEAVLIPVFGEEKVMSERPYTAKVEKDVWTVTGTLYCGDDGKGGRVTDCEGGSAEVKISKSDGRILSIMHYK